jgi:hypothetical protein
MGGTSKRFLVSDETDHFAMLLVSSCARRCMRGNLRYALCDVDGTNQLQ